MTIERLSPCKVNLLLNILGRRPDGFHELETVMLPVPLSDVIEFTRAGTGIELACNHPELPVDGRNLVHRAAERFRAAANIADGVRIRLEKRLPLAAGLGGGSANAAITLRALNELFDHPLTSEQLHPLAAELGSDVPFFLQDGPALATGRGETVQPLPACAALRGCAIVLVHPGFGVSTPWAYRALADFPEALNGRRGRAAELAACLGGTDPVAVGAMLYNGLEAPVLRKHPLLAEFQDYFRAAGALGTLMSGSGSTTFAVARDLAVAERMVAGFEERFGSSCWTATTAL